MKSVLFVIPTLGGGGAEKVLVNLVNRLDREKYDVEVRTLFSNSNNRGFLDKDIKISSAFGKQFRGNRILFKLLSPRMLYRWIIGKRYDIVVSYLEGPGERIVAGCPYKDSKLINWIHVEQHTLRGATGSYRSVAEALKCIARFDYTAFVSKAVEKDYLGIFKLDHDYGVVYNTNDIQGILEKSKEAIGEDELPKGFNVFSIGRLTNAKGFDRLIKAHAKLRKEGFDHNLIILGEGDLRENLRQQAEELGVSDSVWLLGFHKNPYKYLTKADLFVCSSRREGFSTAVTEALVLGIPVVSTLCSGAEELLGSNNEYGIINENSEEGVYQGMKEMLSKEGNIAKYKEMAKQRGAKFTESETVGMVEDLFDRI